MNNNKIRLQSKIIGRIPETARRLDPRPMMPCYFAKTRKYIWEIAQIGNLRKKQAQNAFGKKMQQNKNHHVN